MDPILVALSELLDERRRQIAIGWTPEHDASELQEAPDHLARLIVKYTREGVQAIGNGEPYQLESCQRAVMALALAWREATLRADQR